MNIADLLRLLNEYWVLLAALGVALGWIAKDLLRSKFVTHTFCQKCRGTLAEEQAALKKEQERLEDRQFRQELALKEIATSLAGVPVLASGIADVSVKLAELTGKLSGVENNTNLLLGVHARGAHD